LETSLTHFRTAPTLAMPSSRRFAAKRSVIATAVACFALPSLAIDFQITEDVKLKFNSTVTFGTAIRMESPDPAVY
jgi:hypothetical protein